jgi:hypothetical protein
VILSVIIALAAVLVAALTLNPRVIKSDSWRATVTPLASIIGSGFLVSGPILAHAAGDYAVFAMAALCALAYLFGAVIRFNILNIEPILAGEPSHALKAFDRACDLSLAFAYFISVAYYLNLFAAFALKGAGIVDPNLTRLLSTAVIGSLGVLGFVRGLKSLENVELLAVGLKLALIGGLVAGLAWWAAARLLTGTFALNPVHHAAGWREIQIIFGLVILVQGFETSRYLGAAYDADLRARTMRRAQWIATAVYVAFILLVTPHFAGRLPEAGGETAIIDMLKPLGAIVAPLIILTSISSQVSAAVADMNGASGLIGARGDERLTVKWGYALTAAAAIGVTWAANIFEIITYASKAFVFYYGLQCATAALAAHKTKKGGVFITAIAAIGVAAAAAVILFGAPAEGGQ